MVEQSGEKCHYCGALDEVIGHHPFLTEDGHRICTNCYRPIYENTKAHLIKAKQIDEEFTELKSYVRDCARPEVLRELAALLHKIRNPLGQTIQPSRQTDTSQFRQALDHWLSDVVYLSDPGAALRRPSGQTLLSYGRQIVPFLLGYIDLHPVFLSLVLTEITGVNPITPEITGQALMVKQAWIDWAITQPERLEPDEV